MIALLLGLALAAAPPPTDLSSPEASEKVSSEANPSPPATEVSARYVLKVAHRGDALDAIVAETRRLGGWFARLSNDESVDLRVPVGHAEALQAFIEEQGLVADRGLDTVDIRRELAELDARIDSQRHLVDQYLELLNDADAKAVFQLEHELTNAIARLEAFEGRKRLLLERASTASIHVAFQFRDRRRSNAHQPSPFAWINTLGVERVLDDLGYRWATTARRPHLSALEIEGMASYRLRKEFRATSPDGVVVRTRAFKHKPRADLSFWSEAVQTYLIGQGYILQRDQALDGAEWLEWAVPSSAEELTYVTVVRPNGRRLELVEVAGTAERVEGRREAVLTSLKEALAEGARR